MSETAALDRARQRPRDAVDRGPVLIVPDQLGRAAEQHAAAFGCGAVRVHVAHVAAGQQPCGAMRPTQIAQRPRNPTPPSAALPWETNQGGPDEKHCEGPDRRGPAQAARSAATSTTGGARQELSDRFVTAGRAALAWYDDGMVRRDDAGGKPVGVTLFLSSGCESRPR